MVKVYGYLRVSTGKQELENNKASILLKANELKIGPVEWIEEQISGTKEWSSRKLGELMKIIQADDIIITSEVSRFARKYFDIISFLAKCAEKKIKIYCTHSNFKIDDTIQSQALVFANAISAQLEREHIAERTRVALQRKKEQGVILGRRKDKMILDKKESNKDEIKELINQGVKLKIIAEKYDVTAMTLTKFIKKHNLKEKK